MQSSPPSVSRAFLSLQTETLSPKTPTAHSHFPQPLAVSTLLTALSVWLLQVPPTSGITLYVSSCGQPWLLSLMFLPRGVCALAAVGIPSLLKTQGWFTVHTHIPCFVYPVTCWRTTGLPLPQVCFLNNATVNIGMQLGSLLSLLPRIHPERSCWVTQGFHASVSEKPSHYLEAKETCQSHQHPF